MKRIVGLFLVLALILPQASLAQAEPSVNIVWPNSGENLTLGKTYTIRWEVINPPTDEMILLLCDYTYSRTNPQNILIAYVDALAGEYDWNVFWLLTDKCKIKIATWTLEFQDESDDYFTITDILAPGDVNSDGKVDVLDVTKVARIILMLDEQVSGADANLDGDVNVLDMTKIARIILGLE